MGKNGLHVRYTAFDEKLRASMQSKERHFTSLSARCFFAMFNHCNLLLCYMWRPRISQAVLRQLEKNDKSVGLEKEDALNRARWRVGVGEIAVRVR